MIEICDGHLYDMLYLTSLQNLEMMILCDSQPDERPGSRGAVSLIGDGSEAFPIRVGMTCLQQIRYYLSILTRSDCTTMLHIDSTHSMVIHGYSIFCVWIFGPKLPLLPLAFFCTSQKRKFDIGWSIRYIKRVCLDACGIEFEPQFVMMDAGKAQFNACVTELPHTVVLMCWFHGTKNV